MDNKLFSKANFRSYFSWQKFHELTSEQRKELLTFSVEQIRTEKGLNSVHLKFEDMESSSRGSCSQKFGMFNRFKGHELILNSDILTSKIRTAPYSIFNTINHELEHAKQYENASDRKIGNDDASTLEQRLNDEHYYSACGDKVIYQNGTRCREIRFDSETDYQLYRAQACEAEARTAGMSAVEELRKINISNGIQDKDIDNYIEYARANEINNNRDMMKRLGMHSRENMAKEELNHISEKRVSAQDRARVIAYARQKDYEVAREVLLADSNNNITEEQVQHQFEDDNTEYKDFYQSDIYQINKVSDSERKEYKYSTYRWESDLSSGDNASNEQRTHFRKILEIPPQEPNLVEKQKCQFRDRMETGREYISDYATQRENFIQTINDTNKQISSEQSAMDQSKSADNKIVL